MRAAQRYLAICLVALVVCVALVEGAAPAAAKIRRPRSSREWPARVKPIAKAVEQIRGQKFDHAVRVHFLGDAAFERAFGPTELAGFERRQLRREEALERPLGLIGPDEDLVAAINDGGAGFISGFTDGLEVFVRGTARDVLHDYVLAHELTHVLQGQRAHNDAFYSEANDDVGELMLLSTFEGEADWVAKEWLRSQPRTRRVAFQRQLAADFRAADAAVDFDAVPEILVAIGQAPYLHGAHLAEAIVADQGRAHLNDVVRDPPTDDLGLLNLLQDPQDAQPRVPSPDLADDEERTGRSTRLGALRLYYVLATRLAPLTALDVADQWNGDRAITFTRDGDKCVRVSFGSRDEASAANLVFALSAWAADAGNATIERAETVVLTACGTPTAIDEHAILVADSIAAVRNEIVARGLDAKFMQLSYGDQDIACAARIYAGDPRLVDAFRGEEPDGTVSRRLQDLLDELRVVAEQSCGLDPGRVELT